MKQQAIPFSDLKVNSTFFFLGASGEVIYRKTGKYAYVCVTYPEPLIARRLVRKPTLIWVMRSLQDEFDSNNQ